MLLKWCKEGRINFVKKNKYIINDVDMEFDNGNEVALFEILNSNSKVRKGLLS